MRKKEIEGFPMYEITEDGRVWSKYRNIYLSPSTYKNGYKRVHLRNNGIQKSFFIHRLVAQAFLPNPNNLPCVNHKDENPSNNCLDNLEWCTIEYNSNYGKRNEKLSKVIKEQIKTKGCSGAAGLKAGAHPEAKKVIMCDLATRKEIQTFDSMRDAADWLEMPSAQQNISAVCRGVKKSCAGYWWKYF